MKAVKTVKPGHDQDILLVQWDYLDQEQMQERIDWCRENLVAGEDWGFCAEKKICALLNQSASVSYRLRWFESGQVTQGYAAGLFTYD